MNLSKYQKILFENKPPILKLFVYVCEREIQFVGINSCIFTNIWGSLYWHISILIIW